MAFKRLTPQVDRVMREQEFHERLYGDKGYYRGAGPVELFESVASFENKFILQFFGSLKDKLVIDMGAGTGSSSVYFALRGARVVWMDISSVACQKARELARKSGVEENISFCLGDIAETLRKYENAEADFIYGDGVLHHLDRAMLAQRINSALKKGGKFAFIEPLKYNPLINIYRRLAVRLRSADERPLGFEVGRDFDGYFRSRHREFWLASLLVFMKFYLVDRVHPDAEPYWKKIFYDAPSCAGILSWTAKIDSLLTRIPPLNYLCWNTVLYGKK